MPSDPEPPDDPGQSGLAADVAELDRVALRDRWGLALIAVGWVHLAIFLVCQVLYARGDRAESHFLPLWGLDLVAGGPDPPAVPRAAVARADPALLPLVARVWITFLILAFSSATPEQPDRVRDRLVQGDLGDPEHLRLRDDGLDLPPRRS